MGIKTWDIFCRVVDNFGDIGVCWRLARQLAREYPFQVRLWVDELAALHQIWPAANLIDCQRLEDVEILQWSPDFNTNITPADAVIEAFACDLPDSYLKAMKAGNNPPHWFNLEYLSAEDWVEGCHGLVSVHPQLGLKKVFFFPGFTAKTGGVLKESFLNDAENYFKKASQDNDLFKKIGIKIKPGELLISLFGYENQALPSLLDSFINSTIPIHCLLPAGRLLPGVESHFRRKLALGESLILGSLHLQIIPFVTQTEYDQLLWRCDINFVRGEDSFVRAQWAGRPFIWHIYPQDDGVHMEKLDAFLQRFLAGAPTELGNSISKLWQDWNLQGNCSTNWENCLKQRQQWQLHCESWRQQLNSLGDLASNMVHFCQKTL